MPKTHRTPEQHLALLHVQEIKLKERRKAAEEKLRLQREIQAKKALDDLVKVLKTYGVTKLTPQKLEQALATIR